MQDQSTDSASRSSVATSYSADRAEFDPVQPPDDSDHGQLLSAMDRWERFLNIVFTHPSTRKLDSETLERFAREDAERYLDVKIQLSRCQDDDSGQGLETHFDERFRAIRQVTYQYITTELPGLCENSRDLMALAKGGTEAVSVRRLADAGLTSTPGVGINRKHKDRLVLQRQKLKRVISRQHADVGTRLDALRGDIGRWFALRSATRKREATARALD